MDKNEAFRRIPGVFLCAHDFYELHASLSFFNKVYSCYDAEITALLLGIEEIYANEFTDSNIEEARKQIKNPRNAGRKPHYTEEDIEQIRALRKDGLSIREISEKTGISKSTIQRCVAFRPSLI